jgi:hypothetical protein
VKPISEQKTTGNDILEQTGSILGDFLWREILKQQINEEHHLPGCNAA